MDYMDDMDTLRQSRQSLRATAFFFLTLKAIPIAMIKAC
jgi:hypothetical protein